MTTGIRRAWATVISVARGRSVAAAVFQTIVVRIALLGINFGTGVIVARSLGPLGRGEQAAIALWPFFLAGLATLGVPTALRFHTRQKPETGAQFYVVAFLMMLVAGIVDAVVGALVMPLLLHGYGQHVVRTAQAFMVFGPQVLLILVVRGRLEATDQFVRSILSMLNPNIVTLAVLIVLRLCGKVSPVTAALSYTVPAALQTLLLAVRLWPPGDTVLRDLMDKAGTLLQYGLRSYAADVVVVLSSQVDLAIIVLFLNPEQLGLYTVAVTLSRLLNIVQMSVVAVIFPRASGLSQTDAIALINRAARLSNILSIVLGVSFLLVIPLVLPRLYGEDFRAAIPLMPLLTIEAILGGLGSVLCQGFLATGKPAVVSIIEVGSVILALGSLFVLVPRMNVLGAATALLATSVLRLVTVMLGYPLVLKMPIPTLLPNLEDIRYLRLRVTMRTANNT